MGHGMTVAIAIRSGKYDNSKMQVGPLYHEETEKREGDYTMRLQSGQLMKNRVSGAKQDHDQDLIGNDDETVILR